MNFLDSIYTILNSAWEFLQFLVLSVTSLTDIVIDNIFVPVQLANYFNSDNSAYFYVFPVLGVSILVVGFLSVIKLLLGR